MGKSVSKSALPLVGAGLVAAGLLTGAPTAVAGEITSGASALTIEAEARSEFTLPVDVAQLAEVSVKGDGDTDLDLFVYDEDGNLVCAQETFREPETCAWQPRQAGTFKVMVENLGHIYNNAEVTVDFSPLGGNRQPAQTSASEADLVQAI